MGASVSCKQETLSGRTSRLSCSLNTCATPHKERKQDSQEWRGLFLQLSLVMKQSKRLKTTKCISWVLSVNGMLSNLNKRRNCNLSFRRCVKWSRWQNLWPGDAVYPTLYIKDGVSSSIVQGKRDHTNHCHRLIGSRGCSTHHLNLNGSKVWDDQWSRFKCLDCRLVQFQMGLWSTQKKIYHNCL